MLQKCGNPSVYKWQLSPGTINYFLKLILVRLRNVLCKNLQQVQHYLSQEWNYLFEILKQNRHDGPDAIPTGISKNSPD